jgi:uncharacterized membrane protein YuzA (DUF378 family)
MFSPIIIVLIVLWVLGVATSHTMGGLVHILIGLAAALLVFRFVQKRRADKEQTAARDRKRRHIFRSIGERR